MFTKILVTTYFILAFLSFFLEYLFLSWIASGIGFKIASQILATQLITAISVYYLDIYHSSSGKIKGKDVVSVATTGNRLPFKQHQTSASPANGVENESDSLRRRIGGGKLKVSKDHIGTHASTNNTWTPKRRPLMYTTLFMSVFLFGLCLDATFRPYILNTGLDVTFARLGAVSNESANIFIRSPKNKSVILYYRMAKKDLDNDWKSFRTILPLINNDYTIFTTINQLDPSTTYEYSWKYMEESNILLNTRKGIFKTFPSPYKANNTNPGNRIWSFAFASCVKPNFPYGRKGIHAFRHMADMKNLSFLLFLGDLIYADSPYFICPQVDCYRRKYRELVNEEDYQYFSKKVPSFYIYDDHEVYNNWKSNVTDPYPAAMKAYMEYAGNTNPRSLNVELYNKSYYDFEYGQDAAFFISDTRRYRNEASKTMLGHEQMIDLKKWLIKVKERSMFKFIISSVPLQKNWVIDKQDTWAGFPEARQELLDFIYKNNIKKVIFLTGDRHEVGVSKLHPYGMVDVSVGPLNQFYGPFRTYRSVQDGDESIFEWRVGNKKWCEVIVDAANGLVEFRLWVLDVSTSKPVWTWSYDGHYFDY